MPARRLSLLGPPRLTDGDGASVLPHARKEVALLAYLAVEGARPQQRDTLLGLLWPEVPEESARLSLRVALAHLRAALGDSPDVTLWTDRHTVQLRSSDEGWLDVAAFCSLLAACRTHGHAVVERCVACLDRLAQAEALYRGAFLTGLTVPDSPSFEEWVVLRREDLHRQMLEALGTLAAAHEQAGDHAALCRVARRQLELEPWHEPAHRQLMRGLALAGDRGAAVAQYEACCRVLAEELGIEPDVETRALCERIRAGGLRPATDGPVAPRHNLPASLTPLVGRDAELAELTALLRVGDVRLLTLLGAGGMGKTRLALELARASLDVYADGVFFVALAPLSAPADVAAAIAGALGMTGLGDDPAALARHLRDKRLLLILDNCEHLLAGMELVVTILQAAPDVRLIATSRERLHVRGEHVYLVQGLEYTADAHEATAAAAPAVRLFVQSARRARAGFAPGPADFPAIVQICRVVEGMPLGLELAGAWADLLTPDEIAAELARGADILAADGLDVPARQRSMRAVFAWSWDLLSEPERQVFRRLSVFRGGFTRQAAERVAEATLQDLTALAHKSLLRRVDAGAASTGRYEVHELLRQFAAEQLEAAPTEFETVRTRHSGYYLEFVAAREGRLARDEPREAAAEVRGELDNVRQAWTWAATHAEAAALARAAYGWWQACLLNGLEVLGGQHFGLAAEHLRAALDAWGHADEAAKRTCQRALSTVLAIHANHQFSRVPYDRMAAQAREAVRLGAASGGVAGEVLGTYVLGRALKELGQWREAYAMLEQTIDRARRYHAEPPTPAPPELGEGELVLEAEWLAHLWLFGFSLYFEDYAGGRAHVEEALRLCRSLRKRRGEVFCLSSLAMIDFYTGDDAAARQRYERVLPLARALDDRWAEMRVRRELSEVLRVQGAYGPAHALLGAVVTVAQDLDIWYEEIWAVAALVRLHCQLGDVAGAGRWHDHLVRLLGRAGLTPDCEAAALRASALYALHRGERQQALADAEQAARLTEQHDIPTFRADASVILGEARAELGQLEPAAAAYRQALAWYSVCGNAPLAREPLAGLLRLALARDDRDETQALVESLLPGLNEPPRASVQTPFHADLTLHRALKALHDRRAASVLRLVQQRTHACAEHIDDDALRQSFLLHVAGHGVERQDGEVPRAISRS